MKKYKQKEGYTLKKVVNRKGEFVNRWVKDVPQGTPISQVKQELLALIESDADERFEVIVDKQIVATWQERDAIARKRESLYAQVESAIGRKIGLDRKDPEKKMKIRTWLEENPDEELYYIGGNAQDVIDNLEEMKDQMFDLEHNVNELEEEWRSDPWSRFFLVANNNGHLHSSRGCSTCYPTTQYLWCAEISGLEEEDAVAEYGSQLCTVCFPSAPTEWTDGSFLGRIEKEKRKEKELEKALKKTDEHKSWKKAQENLDRKNYRLDDMVRSVERYEDDLALVKAGKMDEMVKWVEDRYADAMAPARANSKSPKTNLDKAQEEVAKWEAKLEEATEAYEAKKRELSSALDQSDAEQSK